MGAYNRTIEELKLTFKGIITDQIEAYNRTIEELK